MKHLPSVGFLVVGLVIGIVAGKGFNGPSAPPRDDSEPSRTRSVRQERAASSASGRADIDRIRKAAPSQLAGLTRQAMAIPDPVELRRHLTECLLNMTAANWQEVVSGFDKLTKETGRDTPEEWKLALFRAGQVAGENAMDVYLTAGLKNKAQESWNTLYGWGTKDPQAALAWLNAAEVSGHETTPALYSAILAGAALTNPQAAVDLIAKLPSSQRKNCAGDVVWNVIRNSGTEGLDPLLKYACTMEKSNRDDTQLAQDLIEKAADSLLWKADHARSVPQACEAVARITQYGEDPTIITRFALQKYRYYSMPDKLDMVETIRTNPVTSNINLPSLASVVLSSLNTGNNDEAAIREWMGKNPHPRWFPCWKRELAGSAAPSDGPPLFTPISP